MKKTETNSKCQYRPPNFRKNGKLFLVRCFACSDSQRGRENYLPAVASGQCAWCGWKEEPLNDQNS